jgi:4-hydroxythreonine-4-phosphate dehydrogenase
MEQKPVIGILLGDSAGVGPEIVAKVSGSGFLTGHCRPVIIGDNRVYENELRRQGTDVPHYCIGAVSQADWEQGIPVLDQKNQNPADIKYGIASRETGKAVNEMIKTACDLCISGDIAGFAFAPFNKAAMIDAGCPFESEHHLLANIFNVTGPFGEINVLDSLMTTRTTSHIPLKDVSASLTVEAILRAVRLSHFTVKNTGVGKPRIGIAALNPHGGENGHCGREELDVIIPAIQKAREEGIGAEGPYPADILFIKAFKGEFDSVVTMYHDQGQIALKLKGFERGITVAGGQPYPVATCAHGTAYDIAGKGIVSTTAFENAVKMVVKMAKAKGAKTGGNP